MPNIIPQEEILNLAVVNFRAVWGQKQRNLARIISYIRAAARRGADIVCFPELALTGYENQTGVPKEEKMQVQLAEPVSGPVVAAVAKVCRQMEIYAVFGMPERDEDRPDTIYNTAVACGPQGYIGRYRKIHPAMAESCWCDRGSDPFSFETPWGKIAVGICYDTYSFHEILRYHAATGAKVYLNPTAMAEAPHFDWKTCYYEGLRQAVIANDFFVASSNLVGYDIVDEDFCNQTDALLEPDSPGRQFCRPFCPRPDPAYFTGASMVLGPGIGPDKVHVYCGDIDLCEPELLIATVDLSVGSRMIFNRNPFSGRPDYRPDIYKKLNELLLEDPYWGEQ